MNKSYSKLRHIQEVNQKLENRLLTEKRKTFSSLNENNSNERIISHKIENIIENPKVEERLESILANLSDEEKESIMQLANMSPMEIHNQVENEMETDMETETTDQDMEIGEADEQNTKRKLANTLDGIANANISAWGGVPLAIAIGGAIGTVAGGLAISWGATALLFGLAKLLSEKNS